MSMDNIRITTNVENYRNDFMEMVRAFNPENNEMDEDALIFDVQFVEKGNTLNIIINSGIFDNKNTDITLNTSNKNKFGNEYKYIENDNGNVLRCYTLEMTDDDSMHLHSLAKRYVKTRLYEDISEYTGKDLPYGSLTGIRPTKLYRETHEDREYFDKVLHVSSEKLSLIHNIVELQRDYYVSDDRIVDVFVNIPFCTTRCSYCSFISAEIGRVKKYIPDYVECVLQEIEDVRRIVVDNNYEVRAVYIGGGTPTSLDDDSFRLIVNACNFGQIEYTVEAGRPDSITTSKLDIMKEAGVTRISINPQSFSQKTLEIIGRHHLVEDIYKVYEEAKKYDFIINMDLIAMLPEETFDDFRHSVDEAIRLNPNNITVHTLALKKGSKLREANYEQNMSSLAEKMVDYSREALEKAGYKPYYMYRQKYMSGNLENTGYTRGNDVCLYNIDIMEESLSIIANGAGGISKRNFCAENRLERLANPKGIDVYLERNIDNINNKYEFFRLNGLK